MEEEKGEEEQVEDERLERNRVATRTRKTADEAGIANEMRRR